MHSDKGSYHIEAKEIIESGDIRVFYRSIISLAGIVDENIDPTETLHDSFNHPFYFNDLCYISSHCL